MPHHDDWSHEPVEFEGRMYRWRFVGTCWYYISDTSTDGVRDCRLLHREVWASVHGPIPEGGVVHHQDEYTDNNDPANLVLTDKSGHALIHSQEKVELTCSICGRTFLKARRNHEHDEALGIKPVCSRACHSNSPHAREKKRQWYLDHAQLTKDRAAARHDLLKDDPGYVAKRKSYMEAYRTDPEVKAREAACRRAWEEEHREERLEAQRARRARAKAARLALKASQA